MGREVTLTEIGFDAPFAELGSEFLQGLEPLVHIERRHSGLGAMRRMEDEVKSVASSSGSIKLGRVIKPAGRQV